MRWCRWSWWSTVLCWQVRSPRGTAAARHPRRYRSVLGCQGLGGLRRSSSAPPPRNGPYADSLVFLPVFGGGALLSVAAFGKPANGLVPDLFPRMPGQSAKCRVRCVRMPCDYGGNGVVPVIGKQFEDVHRTVLSRGNSMTDAPVGVDREQPQHLTWNSPVVRNPETHFRVVGDNRGPDGDRRAIHTRALPISWIVALHKAQELGGSLNHRQNFPVLRLTGRRLFFGMNLPVSPLCLSLM